MKHTLKTDPAVFQAVADGAKTYEIRFNDRGFAVGDELLLRETTNTGADIAAGAALAYTGREITKHVSHVLTGYGLTDGWAILSFAQRATEAKPSASAAPGIDTPEWRHLCSLVASGELKFKDLIAHIDAAIAAAHEAGRQEAIPQGYVLVPVEPTDDMIYEATVGRRDQLVDAADVWRVMLAAAPHPQAKAQEPASCDCVSGDSYKPYGCEKCNPDLAQEPAGEQADRDALKSLYEKLNERWADLLWLDPSELLALGNTLTDARTAK